MQAALPDMDLDEENLATSMASSEQGPARKERGAIAAQVSKILRDNGCLPSPCHQIV